MNILQIARRARRLGFASSHQYTDEMMLEDLNTVLSDLTREITNRVNEQFFFTYLHTDLIGFNEYKLDSSITKVIDLYVNYGDGEIKAVNIALSSLKESYDELNSRSKTNPIYYIADNSLFLFPKVEEVVTDGIKLNCIVKQKDLTIDSLESDILIDTDFHEVIVSGMIPYIFAQRGKINEEISAINKYERLKDDMISKLSDRNISPINIILPNLERYA